MFLSMNPRVTDPPRWVSQRGATVRTPPAAPLEVSIVGGRKWSGLLETRLRGGVGASGMASVPSCHLSVQPSSRRQHHTFCPLASFWKGHFTPS